MCGIIAATGRIEARYVVALGCLSERRGSDSAGVAWQVGDKLRIAKVAQNPLVAYPVTLAPAIRHAAKYKGVLIGHTRAATTGAITNKNAHPFLKKESKIAWAHNGVISNYRTFGEYEVDSEALIVGIEKRNFEEFWGPVALVWIEGGKLHAFRKGNPLYRGVRRAGVYLASEQTMLEEIGCKRIKELSEGRLYIWNGSNVESSHAIPCNRSYTSVSRFPYTEFAGNTEYRGGGYWNKELKMWVDGEESAEYQNGLGGCAGGRTRPVGFHFRPTKREENKTAINGEVIGEVPLIPAATEDSKTEQGANDSQQTVFPADKVWDGGGLKKAKFEPDSLAELDAENVALQDEITEMEKLCTECQANPKAFGRDYCELCFVKYLNSMGYGD